MTTILDPMPAGPTTDAQIKAFEASIGHSLPSDYRDFLLHYNGGRPEPDAFILPTDFGDQENIVFCLFPMQDLSINPVVENIEELRTWPLHCAWNDLQNDLINLYEIQLDASLLPIGTDGSSNYFCLVLTGTNRGGIVFLDHETAEQIILASSWSAFLESLRPRERTDYAF